jgi:oligopeptide/dipeptide ABC transporter ATP-binding protein
MSTPPLLAIENMRITLPTKQGRAPVVDGVDVIVDEGEIVGVAGESGCGKTMTALSLVQLLPRRAETEGRALFRGRDLLRLPRREIRKVRGAEIAVVFQDPMSSLHPMLSVERQMTEHMRAHLGVSGAAARARAVDLLDRVRIPDPEAALRSYPHQFSGGMRQRIAIAMALACGPKLLIADEPTTALDVTVQAGILRLLDSLRAETGLAVLLISHDLAVISSVADRLYVFYAGRVVEAGDAARLLSSPRHPYTDALLRALPHPERKDELLMPIPGSPPRPADLPDGCVFHPRCAFALPACTSSRPALIEIAPGRLAACPVDPLGAVAVEAAREVAK